MRRVVPCTILAGAGICLAFSGFVDGAPLSFSTTATAAATESERVLATQERAPLERPSEPVVTPLLPSPLRLLPVLRSTFAVAEGAYRTTASMARALDPGANAVEINLYAENFQVYGTFYLTREGEVIGDPKELEHFFRCKRSNRTHVMHPRTLAMLADVASTFPGHVIEVVSGFRRRGIGAPNSKHYIGQAIDFRIRGVGLAKVRNYLWDKYKEMGLGHYHQQGFLHMDFRTEEKIGWNQHRSGRSNHYHPTWTHRGDLALNELVKSPYWRSRLRKAMKDIGKATRAAEKAADVETDDTDGADETDELEEEPAQPAKRIRRQRRRHGA